MSVLAAATAVTKTEHPGTAGVNHCQYSVEALSQLFKVTVQDVVQANDKEDTSHVSLTVLDTKRAILPASYLDYA